MHSNIVLLVVTCLLFRHSLAGIATKRTSLTANKLPARDVAGSTSVSGANPVFTLTAEVTATFTESAQYFPPPASAGSTDTSDTATVSESTVIGWDESTQATAPG